MTLLPDDNRQNSKGDAGAGYQGFRPTCQLFQRSYTFNGVDVTRIVQGLHTGTSAGRLNIKYKEQSKVPMVPSAKRSFHGFARRKMHATRLWYTHIDIAHSALPRLPSALHRKSVLRSLTESRPDATHSL